MAPQKRQQTLSAFFTKPAIKQSNSSGDTSGTADWEVPESKRRKLTPLGESNAPERSSSEAKDTVSKHFGSLPSAAKVSQPVSLPERLQGNPRASKYLYDASEGIALDQDANTSDDVDPMERAELHRRFVKKLGKPDSMYDIKRRNRALFDEEEEQQDPDDEDEHENDTAPHTFRSKPGKKAAKAKLTPMEKQVIDIKQAHADTLLVVEVGYKFRFFGEDARAAAKELGIVCIPGKYRFDEHPSEAHLDRFASASIPVHRLHVHVKRLVQAGHKVGVVRQLETAALKAVGDNRNAPFVRKLTNLYTKGTYIDDVEDIEEAREGLPSNTARSTGFLMCLTETNSKGYGNDDNVLVGIVAVQPATGDVIYDNFEDSFMRSEIETRLLHIAPCELLIVGEVSSATSKLVKHLSGSKANVFGDRVRVEHVTKDKTGAAQAHAYVSKFYGDKLMAGSHGAIDGKLMDKILSLPEHVMICLAALMQHMTDFGLDSVFDLTKYFQAFSARSHMLLNGTTLSSLEIYQNQTDQTVQGSLFWAMDRTRTKFGSRLLRKWIGRPLVDRVAIATRLDAVEEIAQAGQSLHVEKLAKVLTTMKTDLEKSLLRIYYGKCTRPELLSVLQAFQHLTNEYSDITEATSTGFTSPILSDAISKLPHVLSEVEDYLERINLQAAKDDDKYTFFRDEYQTPEISKHKDSISRVESDLDAYRSEAAEKLGMRHAVDYVTVAGIDYLIEVENASTLLKKVPASWQKQSGTKKVSRFHPPEVVRYVKQRDQHKESLAAACDAAFQELLEGISAQYAQFRDTVLALATLDCLMSLAIIAQQPGYTRPGFADDTIINVKGARHPMVEQLLLDAYVPNDILLEQKHNRALLVTGPNMGGKSSYVRSVALIVIMAQVGCFVPADEAVLGITDAVFTRMGAFDNMMAGESTFMVELSETSDILKMATSRSLVILDELGRGTSTHDGVAIAGAVLDWLVREKQCLTLFITHYQVLARLAESFQDRELQNVHMQFSEGQGSDDNITFLYEVGPGIAHRSYGLNVARLAGLNKDLIGLARLKSVELEDTMRQRSLSSISRLLAERSGCDVDITSLVSAIEEL